MLNSIRCLDSRKVGLLSVITLIMVFLAALLMPGCAFWRSPAREALAEHERQVEQTLAEKAAAEAERQRLATSRDDVVNKANQAAALLSVVSPDLAAQIREQAAESIGKFNGLVATWDAEIQAANDRLADQYRKLPALEAAVVEEDARVDRGFGLAEAMLGVGTLLGGGTIATALQVLVRKTRERVAKARQEGQIEGRRIGIGITMDSIEAAKRISPTLRAEFEKLTAEQKRAIHDVMDQLPEWRGVFESDKPTRVVG